MLPLLGNDQKTATGKGKNLLSLKPDIIIFSQINSGLFAFYRRGGSSDLYLHFPNFSTRL